MGLILRSVCGAASKQFYTSGLRSTQFCRPLQTSSVLQSKGGILESTHWTIERAVSIAMLPIIPAAFVFPSPVMDYVLVTSVSLHAFWGLDGVIRDYAFERRYGPLLMPVLQITWKVICVLGFAGLCYFTHNDVGVVAAVKKLWSV